MNPLRNIRIVLVRPMYGGNLGSVCRAMKNMDVTQLAVVQPRASMDFSEAQAMSMHAADILENRRQYNSLAEAVADCHRVVGTTARKGLYRSHTKSAREWAPEIVEAAAEGPVAIVFGTEDNGLDNDELAMCTQLIRIPSSPSYTSLNLAQAVMICCYELYQAGEQFEPPKERHPEASHAMRERMFEMWQEMLQETGFFDDKKAPHMMMAFRRIFARSKLTEADANILMGVARQVRWKIGHAEARSNEPGSAVTPSGSTVNGRGV